MSVILKQLQARCIMAALENMAYGLGQRRVRTHLEVLLPLCRPEKPDQASCKGREGRQSPQSPPGGCWRSSSSHHQDRARWRGPASSRGWGSVGSSRSPLGNPKLSSASFRGIWGAQSVETKWHHVFISSCWLYCVCSVAPAASCSPGLAAGCQSGC